MDGLKIARKARLALADKKGHDIRVLDVRGISTVTDYTVVATGDSPAQLKAMLDEVQRVLKREGTLCYRAAGEPEGGWLVGDYIDAVIHIFSREAREYYAIEELWAQAPTVPDR